MVEFQGVRDGYLQLGVVILGFPVQVDPDASHGKRMSRLGLVNVWNWNTLEKDRFRTILMSQNTFKEDVQYKNKLVECQRFLGRCAPLFLDKADQTTS